MKNELNASKKLNQELELNASENDQMLKETTDLLETMVKENSLLKAEKERTQLTDQDSGQKILDMEMQIKQLEEDKKQLEEGNIEVMKMCKESEAEIDEKVSEIVSLKEQINRINNKGDHSLLIENKKFGVPEIVRIRHISIDRNTGEMLGLHLGEISKIGVYVEEIKNDGAAFNAGVEKKRCDHLCEWGSCIWNVCWHS